MIKALAPIRIRVANQDRWLQPGETVDLPSDKAQKLLQMAGEKVTPAHPASHGQALQAGMIVEWGSPLFGILRGCLLQEMSDHVSVIHPLTGLTATIPKAWLTPFVDGYEPGKTGAA